ncbi:MAG: hypothetical protein IKO12_01125 [Bacteroidaceae bacterium]|nr:hypothetical protein [Bacteroidaceae bacterium]
MTAMHDIPIPEGLEERMSALIDRLEQQERNKARRRHLRWMAAAACVAIAAGIGLTLRPTKPAYHEVTDPEEARRQTEQALMAMSQALNHGLAEVDAARSKVGQIEQRKNISKLIQY